MFRSQFISYYPLKQGLKQGVATDADNKPIFISYYPLKQGLKPEADENFPLYQKNLYPTIH